MARSLLVLTLLLVARGIPAGHLVPGHSVRVAASVGTPTFSYRWDGGQLGAHATDLRVRMTWTSAGGQTFSDEVQFVNSHPDAEGDGEIPEDFDAGDSLSVLARRFDAEGKLLGTAFTALVF